MAGPGSQGRAWKLVEAVHARCVMDTTSRPGVLVGANNMLSTRRDGVLLYPVSKLGDASLLHIGLSIGSLEGSGRCWCEIK